MYSHASTGSRTCQLSEVTVMFLMETFCLPLLSYASEAVSYIKQQLTQLNVCWNRAYRKAFHMNDWDSVKVCRCYVVGWILCIYMMNESWFSGVGLTVYHNHKSTTPTSNPSHHSSTKRAYLARYADESPEVHPGCFVAANFTLSRARPGSTAGSDG